MKPKDDLHRGERIRTDEGLVLRRSLHSETDVRLTIFLRQYGKVMATAKAGCQFQSRLKVLLEPFSDVDIQIFLPEHRSFGRLIGGRLKRSYPHLRKNVKIYQRACQCCETLDLLLPSRAPSQDLFDLLKTTLSHLDQGADPDLAWMWFVAQLLKLTGHGDHSAHVRDPQKHSMTFLESRLEEILPRKLKSLVPLSEV